MILREMEEVEKSSEEVIFDRLHMTAYRDSPLGYTILGPPENIQTITRDHILHYIHENYTSDRLVGRARLSHKQRGSRHPYDTTKYNETVFVYQSSCESSMLLCLPFRFLL